MKKILHSLVALICATVSFAQSSLLATLSHEGTISTFYGASAFKEAMDKAENGDAITLSAGQYTAVNITKAITLRGAGMNMRNDSINSHEATIINGDFKIELTDSEAERLMVEGVYFASNNILYNGTMRNTLFMKTRIGKIKPEKGTMINCTFIHCRIAKGINLSENSNASLVNCVVFNPFNDDRPSSNFQFDNCVVCYTYDSGSYGDTSGSHAGQVINSYYKNCAIMSVSDAGNGCPGYAVPSSCVALYSIACTKITNNNNLFYYMGTKNSTNKNIAKPSIAFKSAAFSYKDNEMYELTDEAKTKYLGTDGKQVGIYGGSLPYEEDPTTPQITKCNVAAKSTADGKLSVDIEVKAAEY